MAAKKKNQSVQAAGKRKTSIARATAKPGQGIIRLNKLNINIIEPELARLRIQEPLLLAPELAGTVDIQINANGGGWSSQIEAARLAIAKVLVAYSGSAELRKHFLHYDRHLLVADTRRKETRKPGTHSRARAKRQLSYR